jgi:trigger factor
MQFTVKTTQGLERRIEVLIPHTRVAGEVDRRLRDLTRTANVRGFRKGKVPLPVIKQQFGGQVQGDTIDALVRQGYSEAVSKENLRPATGPRIEPIQLRFGDDLKFAALIEVLPEVVVKPVDGISIDRPVAQITEADIDAMLESMRRQRLTYRPVDREARNGDRVVVDFLGRLDGTPFQGGEGKGMPFVLGSGRAIADFEAALVGMKAGETKTAPVTFPANYGAAELAGKSAEFDLTVQAVEEEVLPEIDEAFVQSFGINEGGLARLREEVRRSMEREAGEAVRNRLRSQVFEALQRENPLEVPRTLVQEQAQQMVYDFAQRTGRQNASELPPMASFETAARARVLLGLLVGEIVRREDLKVDREKVYDRLDELAASYPDPERVRQAYLQNPDALRQVETAVMEDQVVDWVVANAQVRDQPTTFAELTGFASQGQSQQR